MSKWPHQSNVDSFYGNPRSKKDPDHEDTTWVSTNIVRVKTPWDIVTAWDFQPVTGVRIHKNCSDSLVRIFELIWIAANKDQQKINEWGMNLYAGGFSFRLMKGGSRLSMHSWGCAVDFDSARNSFGDKTPHFAQIPAILDAFKSEEWTWGGKWRKPDGMHWQAADV